MPIKKENPWPSLNDLMVIDSEFAIQIRRGSKAFEIKPDEVDRLCFALKSVARGFSSKFFATLSEEGSNQLASTHDDSNV